MTGCTTSGCIRASAIDSIQYGFRTVVVGDAVGDRTDGPHEANLFDIEARCGDVATGAEVIDYPGRLTTDGGMAAQATEKSNRWLSAPAGAGG